MCVVAELRAVDVRSSHKFEEEISDASSENGVFIPKIEFSVRTGYYKEVITGVSTENIELDELHSEEQIPLKQISTSLLERPEQDDSPAYRIVALQDAQFRQMSDGS
jgi:hypothetical protein